MITFFTYKMASVINYSMCYSNLSNYFVKYVIQLKSFLKYQ